jgi:hypothetical protein
MSQEMGPFRFLSLYRKSNGEDWKKKKKASELERKEK